ncbi:MAG: class I SAM-dependent methyltransferase [Polaromonas sp.]|nr:class I SAM-dependent methyltransferase [Polaromonas sp.]
MENFKKRLLALAVEPYTRSGRFALHFAMGKLGQDPVFVEILRSGLIAPGSHVIDIGCGQGLLSSWLLAAGSLADDAAWPKVWSSAPRAVTVKGIELMPADVKRAQQALSAHAARFQFEVGDMCSTPFGQAGAVVILDVLHYVPYASQDAVLLRVRESLRINGVLILRVGDAAAGLGFKISNWVDAVVTLARGHKLSRLYCRPLADWTAVLQKLGFKVEAKPMSQGTPFANVLLLAHVR